jgi:ribonuclease HI
MEMQALVEGLKVVAAGTTVEIVTDSEYLAKGITSWVKGWMRNGWRTSSGQSVKNRDLWEEMWGLLQERPHTVQWVRGHAGHPENERCDQLARDAIGKLQRGR